MLGACQGAAFYSRSVHTRIGINMVQIIIVVVIIIIICELS